MAELRRRALQIAAAVGLSAAAAGPAEAQEFDYVSAYQKTMCVTALQYVEDVHKRVEQTGGDSGRAGGVILSAHATTPPAEQALNWAPGMGACGEIADEAQRKVFLRTLMSNNILIETFTDKFDAGQIPDHLLPAYQKEYQAIVARLRDFKDSGLVEIKDLSAIQNDTIHQWNVARQWSAFGDLSRMDREQWFSRVVFIKENLRRLEAMDRSSMEEVEQKDVEDAMFMLQMLLIDIGEPPMAETTQRIDYGDDMESSEGRLLIGSQRDSGRFTTDLSAATLDHVPIGFGDLDLKNHPQLQGLHSFEQMFDRQFTFHFQAIIESHFGTQAAAAAIKNDKKRMEAVAQLDRDFGMDKVVKEALRRTHQDLRKVNVDQDELDEIVQQYEMRARMGADRMPEILDWLMAQQRVDVGGYTGKWAGTPNPTGGRNWIETPPLRLRDEQGFWERTAWTEMDRMVNATLKSTPLSPAKDGSGLAVFKPCVTGGKITFTVGDDVIESPENPCADFSWPGREAWGNDGVPDDPDAERAVEDLDPRLTLLTDAARLEATRPKR